MLLWIAIIVVIGVVVYSSGEHGLGFGLAFGLVSSGIMTLILVILTAITATSGTVTLDKVSEETLNLRSLGTMNNTSGEFFLGTGYIDTEKAITYIVQGDDGGSSLHSAIANNAKIYEDSSNPTVTIKEYSGGVWWLLPFDIVSATSYDFHVPEDSVVESYELSTK